MTKFLPAIPADGGLVGRPVDMRIRPCAFKPELRKAVVISGSNVLEALRHACHMTGTPIGIVRTAIVHINGRRVPRAAWCDTYLKESDLVSVAVPLMGGGGGGGKNPLRTILSLVVIGVAAVATMWVGGTGLFGAKGLLAGMGLEWGATAGAIAGGLVMMGGMLLVNALCPASMPKLSMNTGQQESSQRIWSIDGAQNKADPYGVVPTVLGKIRVAPRFAAQSYSVIKDNDQYVRYLYVVSTGDCSVSEPRIGDTALENYQGWEWVVHRDWTGVEPFTWFQQAKSEEALSIEMKHEIGWQVRTTAQNTTHIMIVIVFEGLKHIDSQGNGSFVSVEVAVRYRKVGTEEWTDLSSLRTLNTSWEFDIPLGEHFIGINGTGSFGVDSGTPIAYFRGYTTSTRRLESYGGEWGGTYWETYTYYHTEFLRYGDTFEGTVSFSDSGSRYSRRSTITINGTIPTNTIVYTGCTINPLRKCIEWDVDEGQYEVAMQRVTADSDSESTSSTTRDVFTWTLLQSGRNKPAVVADAKHPLTLVELSLKATEQLNGNVDEFNVLCTSIAPCWDAEAEEWVDGETSNPAALALRIATGYDIAKPASWDEMDVDSFAGFYQWCETHGWKYNGWITSKANSGETFHNVCSAGRGSYALLNGHGVIWDDPDAPVVDMLTQRNSWGFSAQKALNVEQVQGLRVRFLNEKGDFQEDERIVYIDGYDETNATNVIEWEQDGVTDPDLIYKHARLRLAEMQLRPEVYTLSCEAESIALRRGDCIRIAHDVTLWGIASGKIVRVLYADNGNITGIQLDEYCPMDAGQSYGVRITNGASTDAYYSVLTQGATESRELTFSTELPATTNINVDDLVAFGRTQSVGALCKVLSVAPSEGYAAQVTLCDAAPEIYDAITGDIPDWDSQITTPSRYQMGKPVAPVLLGIVSDETVLRVGTDGTLLPQMVVTYQIPDQPEGVRAYALSVYVREHGAEEAPDYYTTVIQGDTATVIATAVDEGKTYDVWAQISTAAGLLSDLSEPVQHTVIGKTSPPPDVTGLILALEAPAGVRARWTGISVLDFDHYQLTGKGGGKTVDTTMACPVPLATGQLTYSLVAVDTGGRQSVTPATASIEIDPPAQPDQFILDTRTDGLYLTWDDCTTSWPIQYYAIEDVYLNLQTRENKTQFVISPRPANGYHIHVQAVDIFGNTSTLKDFSMEISAPATPVVNTEINNGVVRIKWAPVESDFPVRTYQVYSVNGQLLQETDATFYDITAPAGTLEYRVRAVDSAGNMSAFGEVVLELTPPNPPVISAKLNDNRDGIDLSWTVPSSMLPVLTYDVVRQWDVERNGVVETEEQDYGSTDSTSLSVGPVTVGTHTFMVRAVDASGNKSQWGFIDFTVVAPGAAFLSDVNVIDNNVQIYWQEPQSIFFAIAYYNFSTVEDGYASLVGRIDARFASRFERQAGEYTYQICPVDVAGNIGECSQISAQVAQPPDFVFWDDKDSTFNGTMTNAILDGAGSMILPVYPNETWEENVLRVQALLGELSGNYDGALVRDWNNRKWLRLYYLDCGADNTNPFPNGKNAAWDCVLGDTYFSKLAALRDYGDLFKQANGTFEFLAFQSDATGPMTGNASVYAHWTQTENPCTTQGDTTGTNTTPLDGFVSIAKVGTNYPYGMALSTSGSALIDGQPHHGNWYGAVGQVSRYNNGTPYLSGTQPYAQLWIRIDGTEIEEALDALTWQGKIDGGYPAWQSPANSQATYVEIVDVGTEVPSTSINVTVSRQVLEGNPTIACKIEVASAETGPWRVMAENAFQTYANSFRYVRYTFTVTGGMVAISNINYRLDVKKLSDFGSVQSNASDNGDGFEDVDTTPMLYGTWVPFTVAFTDIQSGPIVFCNEEGKTAYVSFEDVLHPTGFRVYVLDSNGTRVSGRVSWSAYGV